MTLRNGLPSQLCVVVFSHSAVLCYAPFCLPDHFVVVIGDKNGRTMNHFVTWTILSLSSCFLDRVTRSTFKVQFFLLISILSVWTTYQQPFTTVAPW